MERRDNLTSTSRTYRSTRPTSPMTRDEGKQETPVGEPAQPASSASIAPAAPVMATSPPFIGGYGGPRFYPPYATSDPDMSSRLAGMTASSIHRIVDAPNLAPTGQRYSGPIYSDPIYHTSRPSASFRGQGFTLPPLGRRETVMRGAWRDWQEGEAGPSSLTHAVQGGASHHQSSRLTQRPNISGRPTWTRGELEEFQRRGPIQPASSRQTLSEMAIPVQRLYEAQTTQLVQELPPPHVLFPGLETPSPVIYGRRHEAQLDLTSASVGRGWPSGEISSSTALPPIKPPEQGSPEPPIAGKAEDGGKSKLDAVQRGRKSRLDSAEADGNTWKTGNAKKTAVACNFCRGRKLRCNGARPLCQNCSARKLECEYVPVQRRRGPGKAKKVKNVQSQVPDGSIGSGTSQREQTSESIAYDLDTLAPELRPYTSVMVLDKFTFQPPTVTGGYSGASEGPETESQGTGSGDGEWGG
ncbi:hypothetical protein AX15_002655 [Amanita polypyramis BW_CC]|nr:hypothetical protein AX15_002655 [Amanita polypyramis BW_CC]